MPLPSASNVPSHRVLILALEAAFAFLFWAMNGKTEYGYGMIPMCPWDIADLEYDGLCTHSPLSEVPKGGFTFTAEELEAQAIRRREADREYHRDLLAKMKARDPVAFNAHKAACLRASRARDPTYKDKVNVATAKRTAKNLASKKYYCEPCGANLVHKASYERHLKSPNHADALKGKMRGTRTAKQKEHEARALDKARQAKKYYCALCKLPCGKPSELKKHNKTKAHLKKVEALETAVSNQE